MSGRATKLIRKWKPTPREIATADVTTIDRQRRSPARGWRSAAKRAWKAMTAKQRGAIRRKAEAQS